MWAGVYEGHRPTDAIVATVPGGATAVSGYLGPVPEGYCWYVERMTCWSTTAAASPVLEVFVLATNQPPQGNDKAGRQDLVQGTTNVKSSVADERQPIFVPPGYFLVASWTGMTAADPVSLSAQIRVHNVKVQHVAAPRHAHGVRGVFADLEHELGLGADKAG